MARFSCLWSFAIWVSHGNFGNCSSGSLVRNLCGTLFEVRWSHNRPSNRFLQLGMPNTIFPFTATIVTGGGEMPLMEHHAVWSDRRQPGGLSSALGQPATETRKVNKVGLDFPLLLAIRRNKKKLCYIAFSVVKCFVVVSIVHIEIKFLIASLRQLKFSCCSVFLIN